MLFYVFLFLWYLEVESNSEIFFEKISMKPNVEKLLLNRGAHFQKNFVGFSWLIHILYNFSRGFHKYNFFQVWTQPVDAQLLPGLPVLF